MPSSVLIHCLASKGILRTVMTTNSNNGTYGKIVNNINYFIKMFYHRYDAWRDLVPFVQFKKCEKHPWRRVNFSKVAGFRVLNTLNMPLVNCLLNQITRIPVASSLLLQIAAILSLKYKSYIK